MKIKEIILKIYEEYFELPEEGKIREKVFIARIAMSVVVMGIWMAMMGFSAYAYFSSSVTSGVNVIKSATYSLDIADITSPDGETKVTGEYVLKNESKTDNKTYKFTLTKAGDASVGYCKIITKIGTAENGIYTTPIGTYKEANGETVEVTSMNVQIILAPEATMTVEFVANWGSYSGGDAMENVVLNYGLSEEELKELQEDSANANTTTQVENPVNTETDTFAQKTEDASTTTSAVTTEGVENSSDETTGTTTDTTISGAPTDTTSGGPTDTTSEGATDTTSDTSTDASQGGTDTPSTDAEETSQINEETTEGTGELMN